jgi:hypothetical protein
VGLTVPPSHAECLEILGALIFWSPKSLPRPIMGCQYLIYIALRISCTYSRVQMYFLAPQYKKERRIFDSVMTVSDLKPTDGPHNNTSHLKKEHPFTETSCHPTHVSDIRIFSRTATNFPKNLGNTSILKTHKYQTTQYKISPVRPDAPDLCALSQTHDLTPLAHPKRPPSKTKF